MVVAQPAPVADRISGIAILTLIVELVGWLVVSFLLFGGGSVPNLVGICNKCGFLRWPPAGASLFVVSKDVGCWLVCAAAKINNDGGKKSQN